MADGSKKPIEDVKVGDKVLATDPETGAREAKTVDQVFVHDDTVVDLVVDGQVITTTEDHPFWSVTDQRFERADELAAGEQVLTADGRVLTVSGLKRDTARQGAAYNLSIQGIHTYHVGDNEILVHNMCHTGGAANAGRVFASSDPLVADAANAIESAIPGRVSGVNTMVKMGNGRSREVDVDLGNVVVQVKSGEARGITGQIQRTAASTGRRVVGYAPGMPGQAWEAAAREGVAIARTPQELVAIVKEWG
jgi:hypothetical protein